MALFKLPVIPQSMPLPDGFKSWWNFDLKGALEKAIQDVVVVNVEQAALLEGQQALLLGQQAQLDTLGRLIRSVSWTTGLTITATPAGATVTITTTDHIRVYVDKVVNVAGVTIGGQPYGTTLFIHYDDTYRDGVPDVSMVADADPATAVPSDSWPVRHLVGAVTTPANSGAAATAGSTSRPPSFPPDYEFSTQ